MEYRTERDSLGAVNVPRGAFWGAETQRALENFPISGLAQYRAFVWAMAVIKRAAAEVNRDLGLLAPTLAEAISASAQEVMDDRWADQFVVDPIQAGAGTSHHMNVNEVIANRANQILGYRLDDPHKPVNPHDHVNMAQSTNDTVPMAIRLGCLWRLEELLKTLDALVQVWEEKSREFDDVIKSGRTHLQDAVPVRLGQEFGAYAQAVAFDRERIATAGDRLRRSGIGGTATGTGLNAHPQFHARMIERINQLTGLQVRSSGNLFESMQSLADPADFSAALNTLALTLTRIANDLRLLASGPTTGLDEIRLPAAQPGSSIMPGKVNPVMAEMLNMACYQVMGNHFTVMLAVSAGQLELNVMMPIVAYNLFQTMDILIRAIGTFTTKCAAGITANRENAAAWLARSSALVTALNPVIGYEKAAQVAQEALARRVPLRQIILEKRYLTTEQLDQVLDLAAMTRGGILNK
ncbi:MAG: aspartate ammonia-lyase [Chloroflexota bacterium]